MREIKFRAWDPSRKIMSQPFWLFKKNGYEVLFITKSEDDERLGEIEYEAKRWIHLQFTGLKDKNGTDIYEGDILEWRGFERSLVQWSSGNSYEGGAWSGYPMEPRDKEDYEIIGNIYEQPELLKEDI